MILSAMMLAREAGSFGQSAGRLMAEGMAFEGSRDTIIWSDQMIIIVRRYHNYGQTIFELSSDDKENIVRP